MMKMAIEVYESERFGVLHVVSGDEEPLYLASDVCAALKIQDSAAAMEQLLDDEKQRLKIRLFGEVHKLAFITPVGLRILAAYSRGANALEYCRWAFRETLQTEEEEAAAGLAEALIEWLDMLNRNMKEAM